MSTPHPYDPTCGCTGCASFEAHALCMELVRAANAIEGSLLVARRLGADAATLTELVRASELVAAAFSREAKGAA